MPTTKGSRRKTTTKRATWAQLRKQLKAANKALASATTAVERAQAALMEVEDMIPGGGGNIVT